MIDFLRLCRSRHIPHFDGSGHKHARKSWVQVCCSQCGGRANKFHLGWNKNSGAFSCYRCGRIEFWAAIQGLLRCSPAEARLVVREYSGHKTHTPAIRPPPVVRKVGISLPGGAGPMTPVHRDYLSGRGFDPEELEREWGLLGTCGPVSPREANWAWRVVAPVCNASGRPIAFQGRAVGSAATPKYKTTPNEDWLEDPRGVLYGIDLCDGPGILVVEGVTGVWRLGPGTVATLGIDWKIPQANSIKRFKRVFICFDDGEVEAQRRAKGLAEHLSLFGCEVEILTGFDTDPGDFSPQLASDIRREIGF